MSRQKHTHPFGNLVDETWFATKGGTTSLGSFLPGTTSSFPFHHGSHDTTLRSSFSVPFVHDPTVVTLASATSFIRLIFSFVTLNGTLGFLFVDRGLDRFDHVFGHSYSSLEIHLERITSTRLFLAFRLSLGLFRSTSLGSSHVVCVDRDLRGLFIVFLFVFVGRWLSTLF